MQPSEHVIITLSGSSTNEFIVGKAEHKTGGTFFFRLEMDSAPGLSGVKGGLIRMMRIEQGGQIHYLYANGTRRLYIQGPGIEDVITELRKSFN